jgi:hypothetical protein
MESLENALVLLPERDLHERIEEVEAPSATPLR